MDYVGIAQNLKRALQDYTSADQDRTGADQAEAIDWVSRWTGERVREADTPEAKGRVRRRFADNVLALRKAFALAAASDEAALIRDEVAFFNAVRGALAKETARGRRENARARMRILVKRLLRKYGYPPDLSEEAVRTVLEQAERFLDRVS